MSNRENELLEQILKETEGRHAAEIASEPGSAPTMRSGTDPIFPEQPEAEPTCTAEQAVSSENPEAAVRHAPASETQPEAAATQTVLPGEMSGTDPKTSAGADTTLEQEQRPVAGPPVQTAQKMPTQTDKEHTVQDVPNTTRKKTRRKKFSYVDVLRGLLPWKGDGAFEIVRKSVFLVSVIGLGVCLELVGSYYWQLYKSEKDNQEILEMIGDIELSQYAEVEVSEGESYERLELSEIGTKLLAQNADTVGFISIPGTKVNYPVVQTTDNEYYGDYSFSKELSRPGAIYLDFRCHLDEVTDGRRTVPNSENLVIYGHNMENLSMFGSLKNYKNNYSYYGEHPLIVLNSNYKQYRYKIFAIFIIDAFDESETKYDCWNALSFPDEQGFYDYVNAAKRRTVRLNDVDVKYGDQLLTLSTCNGEFDTARLIVMARKVRVGEDPYEGTQNNWRNENVLWPTIYYRWNKNNYNPDAEFIPYGPDASTDSKGAADKSTDESAEADAAGNGAG